ncbi:hypothetical protein SKAU_G00310860 [Synaphobranchus kaupii]|uniref:Uncharacterized protein n=1 Tax=Synaphobranchus kaupii TaxID=118154 RepID=A0A9Q1ERR5_SYNKA|nr:hypothetical protein SKAU_G00310860 [Synaphobranchus kaupii]
MLSGFVSLKDKDSDVVEPALLVCPLTRCHCVGFTPVLCLEGLGPGSLSRFPLADAGSVAGSLFPCAPGAEVLRGSLLRKEQELEHSTLIRKGIQAPQSVRWKGAQLSPLKRPIKAASKHVQMARGFTLLVLVFADVIYFFERLACRAGYRFANEPCRCRSADKRGSSRLIRRLQMDPPSPEQVQTTGRLQLPTPHAFVLSLEQLARGPACPRGQSRPVPGSRSTELSRKSGVQNVARVCCLSPLCHCSGVGADRVQAGRAADGALGSLIIRQRQQGLQGLLPAAETHKNLRRWLFFPLSPFRRA